MDGMKEVIEQAKEQNMKANTIESLMFLNHVMDEMIDLEELLSE